MYPSVIRIDNPVRGVGRIANFYDLIGIFKDLRQARLKGSEMIFSRLSRFFISTNQHFMSDENWPRSKRQTYRSQHKIRLLRAKLHFTLDFEGQQIDAGTVRNHIPSGSSNDLANL